MEVQKFQYNKKEFEYYLTRKDVKNININVKPNLKIEVSASDKVPLEKINETLRKKYSWINKNLNYFKKSQGLEKKPKEYVNGESFKYLGKQYRLKVIQSKEESTRFYRGFIRLYVKNTRNTKKKKQAIENWYRERSLVIFEESLERMHKLIQKYNVEKPNLKIRQLKSRWGSCFRDKKQIILNSDLIEAPKFCIDYVILHELVHFKYENHNKDFIKLLTALMPDWEKRKEILDFEVIRNL